MFRPTLYITDHVTIENLLCFCNTFPIDLVINVNNHSHPDALIEKWASRHIQYHFEPLKDTEDQDLLEVGHRICDLLLNGCTNQPSNKLKKIAIHCAAGKSRSVAIVALYLMKKHHWGFSKGVGAYSNNETLDGNRTQSFRADNSPPTAKPSAGNPGRVHTFQRPLILDSPESLAELIACSPTIHLFRNF